MKFILFILIAPFFGFSQIEIYNTDLIDTTKMILYRGFPHDLRFLNLNQDSTYFLTNKHDTFPIYRYSEHEYRCIITAFGPAESATYWLMQDTKTIDSFEFETRKYADFKVYLGSLRDTIVSKEELIANFTLLVSHEPEFLKSTTNVVDFQGRIIKKSGREIEIQMFDKKNVPIWMRKKTGDEFCDAWISRIEKQEKVEQRRNKVPRRFKCWNVRKFEKLKRGDMVMIDLVRLVESSSCQRMYAPNLRFYITN